VLEYGFWTFLLIAVGRLGELVPGLASLPIAKIALGVPLLVLIRNWKRLPGQTAVTRPLARTAIVLAVLAVLLTPISYWKGASREFLLLQFPTLLAATTIAYMMCRSWRTVRGTLLVLVLSGLILARAAVSSYTGGRAQANTMYDTNDLAYILVTVLPLVIAFLVTAKTTAKRLIYFGIGAVMLGALLLTQSRGGFLGLVLVTLLACLMRIQVPDGNKRNRKFLSLLGVVLLGAVIWTQLPQDARNRFATVLNLGNDYNLDPTNDKSRGQIWSRGLKATLDRPFGYGPQAFGMVDYRYGGRMMAPHNSYMEAMVELGVLGIILFLRMYLLSWRGLERARRKLGERKSISAEQKEQMVFARVLQLSLAGNAVAGFFLSMTYATILWVTFGICMAMMALEDRPTEEA
jgi:O-antigen ligase